MLGPRCQARSLSPVVGKFKINHFEFIIFAILFSRANMSNYKGLEIYQLAFDLSVKVHHASLNLPAFELYEQGSQIRRSSKGVKDNSVEGYGRRRYKADYIKFLTYAIASCDETENHVFTIRTLYPDLHEFKEFEDPYDKLGRKINNYLQYVEEHWNT